MSSLPANLPNIASARLPATYEAAKKALSACSRIDECQEWADKAEALASYAKQAEDDQLRKLADRIQARAIRRCGELLKQIDGRGKKDGAVLSRTEAAEQAGLSERQRKTAVRVADLPDDEFTEAVESDAPPTVTQLAERGKKRRVVDLGDTNPQHFATATQALGRLREFASFAESTNVEAIAAGIRPNEAARAKRDIQTIDRWLDQLITRI